MVRKNYLVLAVPAAAMMAVPALADYSATERPDVSVMSMKEIRVHNEGLDSADPFFIKCRRSSVTGSLVKKARLCLTNLQWRERATEAQNWTNDAIDRARSVPCPPPACAGE